MEPTTDNLTFLRARDVCAKTGLSRSTLWRLERKGAFPRRHRIACHAVGWLAHEVDQWAREQIAARPNPAHDLLDEREVRWTYLLLQPTLSRWLKRGLLKGYVQADGEVRFRRADIERRLGIVVDEAVR